LFSWHATVCYFPKRHTLVVKSDPSSSFTIYPAWCPCFCTVMLNSPECERKRALEEAFAQ